MTFKSFIALNQEVDISLVYSYDTDHHFNVIDEHTYVVVDVKVHDTNIPFHANGTVGQLLSILGDMIIEKVEFCMSRSKGLRGIPEPFIHIVMCDGITNTNNVVVTGNSLDRTIQYDPDEVRREVQNELV